MALKPFSARQGLAALSYALPFTLFVVVAFRGVAGLSGSHRRSHYAWVAGTMATRFFTVTGVQDAALFTTGHLPIAAGALNAIVALQFTPLLVGLGFLAVHTWRRTGSYVPGALIGGLFITWYMVAGTATHVA